jgi:hypothetical protein
LLPVTNNIPQYPYHFQRTIRFLAFFAAPRLRLTGGICWRIKQTFFEAQRQHQQHEQVEPRGSNQPAENRYCHRAFDFAAGFRPEIY